MDPIFEEQGDPVENKISDNNTDHPPKRLRTGYRCDVCATSYTEKRSLLRHLRTPAHCEKAGAPVEHYPCEHCYRNFSRRDLLQRHGKEVHSNIKRSTKQTKRATSRPPLATAIDTSAFSLFQFDDSSGSTAYALTTTPFTVGTSSSGCGSTLEAETEEGPARVVAEYDTDDYGQQDPCSTNEPSCIQPGVAQAPALSKVNGRLFHETSEPVPQTASVRSTSSFDSTKSPFDVPVSLSRAYLIYKGASPRFRGHKRPVFCALCREHLGHGITEVRAHLEQHSKTIDGGFSCQTCQIKFTHERDFERHQTAASHGHCGFDFDHAEPCQGHHPPDIFSEMLTDNDRMQFSHRLLHWEQVQLRTYLDQVSDLISVDPLTLEGDCWSMGGLYSSLVSLPSILGERKPASTLEPGSYMGRSSRARLPFNWRVKATALALLDSTKLRSPRNLAVAAKSGDKEKVRWLIDSGADVNTVYECKLERSTKESEFVYPLEAAIYGGDLETVEVLIDRGALVNGSLMTSASPLLYCVQSRRLAIARLLIGRGADSIGSKWRHPTALHEAVVKNQTDMVEVMLEHATDVHAHPEPTAALNIAISLDYTDMVHLLLRFGANVNAHPGQDIPLVEVTRRGSFEMVQLLLEHGADPNAESKGCTAMMIAAARYDMRTLELLMQYGADVHK